MGDALYHHTLGKTNQNQREAPPHGHEDGYNQKETITSVGRDVETLEPSYMAGENVR